MAAPCLNDWQSLAKLTPSPRPGTLDIGPDAGRRPGVGRIPAGHKKTIAVVWRKMEKVTLSDSGQEVGFLSHFLTEVNLTDESPGKRAKAFSKILAARRAAGRVEQKYVESHPGQPPYVATEATFAILLKHL